MQRGFQTPIVRQSFSSGALHDFQAKLFSYLVQNSSFSKRFLHALFRTYFWVKIILNRKLFKTNVSTNTKCRELHVLSIIFLPDIQSHRWIQFNKKWRTQTSWHCLFNLPMQNKTKTAYSSITRHGLSTANLFTNSCVLRDLNDHVLSRLFSPFPPWKTSTYWCTVHCTVYSQCSNF